VKAFFLEPSIPYTSEALKKENVKENLGGAAVDQAVFAIQLSILNRMSLLAGFFELGRPTALALLVLSLQLPKRSRSDSTSQITAFERSRWRGGRFACYAPHVMPQRSAFNCDFRFPLIFLSHAKSIGCKRKKIQFP
jgi:hypothetical protein